MNDSPTVTPVPAAITQAVMAPVLSRAVYAVAALGIPDLLSEGPLSVADLAKQAEAEPAMLHPILRTVATTGLLRTRPDGRIELTDDGRFLTTGHPGAGRDLMLTLAGPTFYAGLGAIVDALREGRTGVEVVTGKHVFEVFAQDPQQAAAFNRTMVGYHGAEPAAVVAAYDFPAGVHVVDVGGGIGTMLDTVLRSNTSLRGTLFDRQHVVSDAQQHLASSPAAGRTDFAAGDFFDSVPAGGDVYLLSHIIHDWDDRTCVSLLRRCAAAMAPGGRILVVEAVLADDDEPDPAKILDVIVTTLHGGQERTVAEFSSVFAEAGLRLERVVPTGAGVSVLEVRALPGR